MKFTLWPFSITIDSDTAQILGAIAVVVTALICVTYHSVVTPTEERAAIEAGLVQKAETSASGYTHILWVKPEGSK